MINIKRDAAFALVLTILGIWITWESFSYSLQSSFFLRGLAIILVVMSATFFIIRVVQYRRLVISNGHSAPYFKSEDVHQLLKALLVFGLVGGYIVTITLVGFALATFFFVYLSMCFFSGKHRNYYLAYSAILSILIFMLFFNALGVSLPDSILPLDEFFKIV